jgi:hypothetical protein
LCSPLSALLCSISVLTSGMCLTSASMDWWLKPAEWNIDAGLPEIKGNINAISFTGDGKRIWIAGDAGLLAFSNDQGAHWTLLSFDPATQQFRIAPANTPSAAAFLHWEIVPTVHASAPESSSGAAEKPPTQQGEQFPNQQQSPNQQQQSPNQQQQSPIQQQQSPNQQQAVPQIQLPSPIIISRNPVEFGSVAVGSQKTITLTLTNRTLRAVKLSLGATRDPAWNQFDIKENKCGGGLASSQACTVTLIFKPLYAGNFNVHLRDSANFTETRINVLLHGVSVAGTLSGSNPGSGAGSTGNTPSPSTDVAFSSAPDLDALQTSSGFYVRGKQGVYFQSRDGGNTWVRLPKSESLDASKFTFTPSIRNTAAGQELDLDLIGLGQFEIRGTALSSNPGTQWYAGTRGVILRSEEKGKHWFPVTRAAAFAAASGPYTRFLPPWYWLALGLCVVLMVPVFAPPVTEEKVEEFQQPPLLSSPDVIAQKKGQTTTSEIGNMGVSDRPLASVPASGIGNQAISDRPLEPGEPDALGLGAIAAGLAFFLRNDKTRPPLVLAINGRWGSGKSSLMNLLKKELQDSGTCPVWFNAWHHQKENQLLAALLQAVRVQAIPSLSTWRGWAFRRRLLWMRLRKYWFRLAVLAGIIFLMYRAEVFLVQHSSLNLGSLLNLFLNPGQPGQGPLHDLVAFLKDNPVISVITGLAAGFKTISRGLTAFGANPASLLTSISGGSREKELDAQTSFRQKFSADFAQVTQALGRHRMLILIDDLDRCRPEKIRETLEAVNFLVSSGECFLVLGMAREIVEHCVGLSFSRVVDTMGWDAMGLADEEIEQIIQATILAAEKSHALNLLFTSPNVPVGKSGNDALSVEAAAKRRAFARLYMDKLVQIEVAVPEPTPAQRRMLFQTDQERASQPEAEKRVATSLKVCAGLSRWLVPVAQAAMIALTVAVAGMTAGHYVKPVALQLLPARSSSSSVPGAAPAATPPETPQAAANPSGRPAPTPSPAAAATDAPAPQQQLPSYQPGDTAAQLTAVVLWPLLFALSVGISVAGNSLLQVTPRKVTDTQVFVNALKIWQRLVMTSGAKNTPRTARRFQNRVRYLAMRQRALSQGRAQSRLERWLRRLWHVEKAGAAPPVRLPETEGMVREIESRAAAVQAFMDQHTNAEAADWSTPDMLDKWRQIAGPVPPQYLLSFLRANIYIPEPILVGLAALEEYEPAWVHDQQLFSRLVLCAKERLEDGNAGKGDQRYETLLEVVSEHLKAWDNWTNLEHYRRAYLNLGGEAYGTRAGPPGPPGPRASGATAGSAQ